ncbi:MAG: hypothetical protein GF404_09495 [candidate division Zixibacteria bacterium]|nr:hypothetical protein [candidate division Zixibacteria bacterium]
MAKILHTADIHLGIKLSGLGKSGDKVRAALKDSISKLVEIALEQKVDAVVIAGDLFDSNRISKPLFDFAMREISRLEDVPVVLIPGTHDCLEEQSVYVTMEEAECPKNLFIFDHPDKNKLEFPERGLTFYCNVNTSRTSSESPLADLKPDETPGTHIAIAHGSVQIPGKSSPKDWPIKLDEIENSGFDYVALGHWHSYFRLPTLKVPAVYSGTPEPMSFKHQDAGWASLVEFEPDKVEIEKVKLGKLEWNTIELPCTSFKYTLELEREISKHISENRLLKVLLNGVFPSDGYIDFDRLHEHMADRFLYLEVVNRTETVPSDMLKLNLPETTILGQYIHLVSEKIAHEEDEYESELLNDSMKLGYALLSGKDVI